jgi:maleate cis-trans isomerase
VHGTEGVQRQIDALAAEVGVPATSTSHAFVRAVRALGADSVYLLAPYPDEIAQLFVDFLGASGITVSHRVALGSPGGTASAALRRETFSAALAALAPPPTAIVVMPDTAVHGLALGPDLAQLTEATVLTANQVTIWHGLQLAGSRPVDTRLGALSDVVAID